MHRHGPRINPCPGSDRPPLASQPSTSNQQQQTSQSPSASASAVPDAVNTAVIASSLSTTAAAASPVFCHPHDVGALIKHIPKSARPACATHLASLITKVIASPNDLETWSSLLHFGANILQKPVRTGSRHNLASIIMRRTGEAKPTDQRSAPSAPHRKKRDANELLAAAVTAKIEDGNIKAAVRILCSEEKPATDTDATYIKLLERHPAPPRDRKPASPADDVAAVQASEAEVLMAIRTFPAGSSGGPDGIRPQHILDLVTCQESGPALLTAITALVNALLRGTCNPAVAPVLFGGQLMALEKKSGGIRPIAIGYTWRRIAAKCANAHATAVLAGYLQPLQLGVGTPGAAVRQQCTPQDASLSRCQTVTALSSWTSPTRSIVCTATPC
jgi:hypothetical protein